MNSVKRRIIAELARVVNGFASVMRIRILGRSSSEFLLPNMDIVLKKLIKDSAPTILDIGANEGQSIRRFKKLFPQSQIFAFEPIESLANLLQTQFSHRESKIEIINEACSNHNGISEIHINSHTGNSSILPLIPNTKWLRERSKESGVAPTNYTVKKQSIKLEKIDTFIDSRNLDRVHFVKIDTQGYELNVLQGMSKALQLGIIDVIQIEIIHTDIYLGNAKLFDIENELVTRGYKLVAVSNGGSLLNYFIFQQDLVYVSPNHWNQFYRDVIEV